MMVKGFLAKAARPSPWARMATLSGNRTNPKAVIRTMIKSPGARF